MSQSFKIKIANDSEFSRIASSDPRYSNVNDDSMGFADKDKGLVVVRNMHVPELNRYLVNHEISHLFEEVGTDEDENGIRHKKASSIGRAIGTALALFAAPITGGASLIPGTLAAATGGAAGSAIGGAIGKERALGRQAVTGAATGAGSALGGFAGGKLASSAASPIIRGAATGAGIGAGGSLGQSAGQAITGQSTGRGVIRQALTGGLTGGLVGGATGALSPKTVPAQSTPPAPSTPKPLPSFSPNRGVASFGSPGFTGSPVSIPSAGSQSVTPRLGSGILAGGLAAASPLSQFPQAGIPNPQTPVPPPQQAGVDPTIPGRSPAANQQQTQGQPQAQGQGTGLFSGADLARIGLGAGIASIPQFTSVGPQTPQAPNLVDRPAIQQFSQDVRGKLEPLSQQASNLGSLTLPDDRVALIRRQFDAERDQFKSQFKVLRPNADVATDSAFRQGLADIAQREADSLTNATTQFQNEQRANIGAQLGVDQTQLDFLQQLAGLDLEQIRTQTGLDAEEAAQFKQLFGSIGAAVAAPPSPLAVFGRP